MDGLQPENEHSCLSPSRQMFPELHRGHVAKENGEKVGMSHRIQNFLLANDLTVQDS